MPPGLANPRLLQLALLIPAASLLVHANCAGEPRWPPQVQSVPSPAAGGSGYPQMLATGARAVLSWIERAGPRSTLKFAERTASGWSEPRVVASGDDWFINSADLPSVVRLDDGSLAAHWLQHKGANPEVYDLRLAFSTDDGVTWTAPVTPYHEGTDGQHGFASLFQMPGAGLGVVWLDGRTMSSGGIEHEGLSDNVSFRAAAFDRSRTQLAETVVDGRVCECCPTAVGITADGPIAAFRDRSAGEVRDIAVSRLVNGAWSESKTVANDDWNTPSCPVNGPAISARDRQVAIAWFTVGQAQGRAFVAFSSDAGVTFGSPIRIDDNGSLGRVDIALLDDGSAVAAWMEFSDQRAQFRFRRVTAQGGRSPAETVSGRDGGRVSGYPRLERVGHELLFAWTETAQGASNVRTAVAPIGSN